MEVIPGDVIIEPPRISPAGKSQPIEMLAPAPGPELPDAVVREAIMKAEANNQDPMTITVDELSQGQVKNPEPAAKPSLEVPAKFLKSDGVVDVEKIQASTKQLDEALAEREPVPQKTVDDYLKEYQEKEKLFRSGTVPKVESAPPAAPLFEAPQNFDEIVRRDFQQDPLGTLTRLTNLMIEQRLEPIAKRDKLEGVRSNIQEIAKTDHRVLRQDIFAAINSKLAEWKEEDPHRYQQKNPHKAAWLEVKEEMRLGELVQNGQGQAQPSRPSPVLGGGTPPSAPSSSVQQSLQNVVGSLHTLDLRDKKQEAMGDEAIRALLASGRG